MFMIGGVAFGLSAFFFAYSNDYFYGFSPPYHLMTDKYPVQWAEEEDEK